MGGGTGNEGSGSRDRRRNERGHSARRVRKRNSQPPAKINAPHSEIRRIGSWSQKGLMSLPKRKKSERNKGPAPKSCMNCPRASVRGRVSSPAADAARFPRETSRASESSRRKYKRPFKRSVRPPRPVARGATAPSVPREKGAKRLSPEPQRQSTTLRGGGCAPSRRLLLREPTGEWSYEETSTTDSPDGRCVRRGGE